MPTDHLSRNQILAGLNAIVTAIGATALVRLFTAGPSGNEPAPTLADFTEPEGTWYDPTDVNHPVAVYGQPFLNGDGGLEVRCESVQFNFLEAAGNEPQNILGWMVTAPTGTTVHHWGFFDEARQLASNLDSVIVQPGFALPATIAP